MSATLSRRALLRAGLSTAALTLPMPALLRSAQATGIAPLPTAPGYTRLFPALAPARFDPNDLARLALGDGEGLTGMSAEPETVKAADKTPKRDANGHLMISATAENEQDDEENFGVPAGYTYLGQFIDHDLTLNPIEHFNPLPEGQPGRNLRTARFDLDNLYGRGPEDQPYLYEGDGRRLLTGRPLTRAGAASPSRDHPRMAGRALIGDKRNDENVIVSQLHGAFAAFHNAVAVDEPTASFDSLRLTVTRHYQWVVLTDFLPRMVGADLMARLLPGFGEGGRVGAVRPQLAIAAGLPAGTIPLEFSDAAYRFGHSMIRPVYRLNARMRGSSQDQRDNPAIAGRRLIFAASPYAGLNGFREYPTEWAIDWRLFFEIERKLDPAAIADGRLRVQAAYKFDTSLVNPLAFLPEFSQGGKSGALARDAQGQPRPREGMVANLAHRNLLRGVQRGMPGGQAVAQALGLDPLPSSALKVGKATMEAMAENKPVTDYGDSFRDQVPLWFYVLAEAQAGWAARAVSAPGDKGAKDAVPSLLGPVGGRLVAESFIAMMLNDLASVLNAGADWRPRPTSRGRFARPELIGMGGLV
jgi:hypothetical protein